MQLGVARERGVIREPNPFEYADMMGQFIGIQGRVSIGQKVLENAYREATGGEEAWEDVQKAPTSEELVEMDRRQKELTATYYREKDE